MNKTRILGVILFITGLSLMYFFDTDFSSFIGGLFVGIGAVTAIAGKTIFSKKTT